MKYLKVFGLLTALAAMTVFVPSTAATPSAKAKPASHVQPGSYSGSTSQGHGISFNVVEGGANDFIDSWSVGFNLRCTKTGRTTSVGHGFGGFNVQIDPAAHTFTFEYGGSRPGEAFFFSFRWKGEFTSATTAQGTTSVTWGGVYNRNKAEPCKSGSATWTAAHTSGASKPDFSRFDVVFNVKKGQNGQYSVQQVK